MGLLLFDFIGRFFCSTFSGEGFIILRLQCYIAQWRMKEFRLTRRMGIIQNKVTIKQGGNDRFLHLRSLKSMPIYLQIFRNVLVLPGTPRCCACIYITFRIFQFTTDFSQIFRNRPQNGRFLRVFRIPLLWLVSVILPSIPQFLWQMRSLYITWSKFFLHWSPKIIDEYAEFCRFPLAIKCRTQSIIHCTLLSIGLCYDPAVFVDHMTEIRCVWIAHWESTRHVSDRSEVRFLVRSLSFAPFCCHTIALLDLDGDETFPSLTAWRKQLRIYLFSKALLVFLY
jgi:hypothetical protein